MKETLQKICSDTQKESQWLNTLSLLEFIGARKISRTVAQTHPTLAILEHHADETRHAYIFKKLSYQLNEGKDPGYLGEKEAVRYFQGLDHQLKEWIQERTGSSDPYANYLLTTAMIEQRAMKLYPLYSQVTSHGGVKEELLQVIAEENSHRHVIESQAFDFLATYQKNDFSELQTLESELFQQFNNTLREILLAQ